MVKRQQVEDLARTYKGVLYRHQGRSRTGIDCAGVIVLVGNELGLIDYDTDGYMRDSTGNQIFDYFRAAGMVDISPLDILPADIVLTRDSIFPCHSAFVAQRDGVPTIIHAYAKRRVVLEERLTEEWENKIVGAFRFVGLED